MSRRTCARGPRISRPPARRLTAVVLAVAVAGSGCVRSLAPCPDPPAPQSPAPRLVRRTAEAPPRLIRKNAPTGAGAPTSIYPPIPLPERSLEPLPPSDQVDLFADRYQQQQSEARENLVVMSGVTILSGVAIMMLMTLLPQDATNWESGDDKWTNFTDAWTSPPEWDKDDWPVNYLVHPWMGAIFYLLARDLGAEPLGSFAYSTGLSFSWEYLVESWSEQPSAQDLLTTSPIGSLLGEGFYLLRTGVLHDDSDGFSWKKTAGWLLDPVDLTYELLDMKPEPPPRPATTATGGGAQTAARP